MVIKQCQNLFKICKRNHWKLIVRKDTQLHCKHVWFQNNIESVCSQNLRNIYLLAPGRACHTHETNGIVKVVLRTLKYDHNISDCHQHGVSFNIIPTMFLLPKTHPPCNCDIQNVPKLKNFIGFIVIGPRGTTP